MTDNTDMFESLGLRIARKAAYDDGVYELDDEIDGFFECDECGNRQISAAATFDDDGMTNECDECGENIETNDTSTDWAAVREKLPEEYVTGEAMETDLPECPACKQDMPEDGGTTVTIGDRSADIHERCAEGIWDNSIENPYWYDTLEPEHYEKAVDYLRQFDTVGCVVTHDGHGYALGEFYIHTNYCTTEIVDDLDIIGARVVSAGVVRGDDEHQHDCTNVHGDCFEILVDFCTKDPRYPVEELDQYFEGRLDEGGPPHSADYFIKEYDTKVFDADFSVIDYTGPCTVPEKHR